MAVVIVAFGIKKNEREREGRKVCSYTYVWIPVSLSLIVRLFHFYSTDSDNKVNQYEEEK